MAKPTIYWALSGSNYRRFTDLQVMRVTSEKGGRRGQAYGTDEHGVPTHCSLHDIRFRFETEEEAKRARGAAREQRDRFQPLIKAASDEVTRLYAEQDAAAREAIKALGIDLKQKDAV
jgi:hypothetical protein